MPRNHYVYDIQTGESTLIPFTAEEEAEADARDAQAADRAAAAASALETRQALVEKLQSGTASPEEMQAALAALLNR